MRKLVRMGLCALLCLSLASCGGPPPQESIPPVQPEGGVEVESPLPSAQPSPASPETALTGPPELVVSISPDLQGTAVTTGNFTWRWALDGGMEQNIIACGASPLDAGVVYAAVYTAFPPGALAPLPEGQMPGAMLPVFFLDFGEVPPETVTARRWPSALIGQEGAYEQSEEVAVDDSDSFALLPAGDGEFVYEVHADWGETGSADYIFQTLPQTQGRLPSPGEQAE